MTDRKKLIDDMIAETMKELYGPEVPKSTKSHTRTWNDPTGYVYLVPWSNAVLLRFFVRMLTSSLPKSEYRRKSQVDDASRSVVRNIEEGFKRSTTSEYIQFIGYSQGSLEEVKGDIREMTEDRFLRSRKGSGLTSVGIHLKALNESLRKYHKGDYRRLEEDRGKMGDMGKKTFSKSPIKSYNYPLKSFKFPTASYNSPLPSSNPPLKSYKDFSYRHLRDIYPPLSKIHATDLTYEIFIELINKTDYVLRTLVTSLEKKLIKDRKGYQVERARIQYSINERRRL